MEQQQIAGIPDGLWNIYTWLDGRTFRWVNTESKVVGGHILETAYCGCCSDYVDCEWDWAELDEEEQVLIIEEFTDGNFK